MLDQHQRAIVKATVPALREHGETISRRFYSTMLTARPELLNYFNPANQGDGGQARSLAASVLAYAENIDRLGVLGEMVERIVAKHVSLEILPEHYPIVGQYLLGAIAEVLGVAATPDILDAWTAAYNQLADIMIGREVAVKKAAREQPGGWSAFKPFRVVSKVPENKMMTSFILEPQDGTPLPRFSPGQYISVKVRPPGLPYDQIRQYSLSAVPNGRQFRISVKQEDAPTGSPYMPPGTVSNYLHRNVQEGDTLLVHTPAGRFMVDERNAGPVVLMSGGSGITAVLGMFEHLVKNTSREVLWLHAARSREYHSFGGVVQALGALRGGLQCLTLYETVSVDDVQGRDFDAVGRISVELLRTRLPEADAEFYYCGPAGFMTATEVVLDALKVPPHRRHNEAFAPDVSFFVGPLSIETAT